MSKGYGIHYRPFHPDLLGYIMMLTLMLGWLICRIGDALVAFGVSI
jgi:hypothetical protein